MATLMTPDIDVETITDTETDKPYSVVLHNDPINLMRYVVNALIKVLDIDETRAAQLMQEAHLNGKTAVFDGGREECLDIAAQLNGFTLQTTVEER